MEFVSAHWLPIIVSAVFVFIVSSAIHMLLTYHNSEYKLMAGEDNVLESMRTAGVVPGHYAFPKAASMKEMGTPEMIAKFEKGPVGFLTVVPSGAPAMGKNLTQWFIYSVVISVFAAYMGSAVLERGASYLEVFRVTGTTAFLAYGLSHVPDSVWKGMPWSATLKHMFDGLVYALVTAGTFGWLW